MPELDHLRASDAERERVADALRGHAAAGRLDAAELEDRVGAALTARTRGELAALTADLPGPAPAAAPARAPRPAARTHAPVCRSSKDPRAFVPIAVLLIAIWAVTGMGYFWPVWPIMGFAIAALPQLAVRGNPRGIRSHGVHR